MGKLKILIGIIVVITVLLVVLNRLEKFYETKPAPVSAPAEPAPVPEKSTYTVVEDIVTREEFSEARARAEKEANKKARALALAAKKRTPAWIIKSYSSDWDEPMITEKEYKALCDAIMDYVLCKSITTRNPKYHSRFKLSSIKLMGETNMNLAGEYRQNHFLLFTMRALARGKMTVDACVRYYDINDANIKSDVYPDYKPEPKEIKAHVAAAVRSFCKQIVQEWTSSGGMNNACKGVVAKGIISEEECRLMFPRQSGDCDGDSVCLLSLGIFEAFQTGNSLKCRNNIRSGCRALMDASPDCTAAADALTGIYRSYKIRKVEKAFETK